MGKKVIAIGNRIMKDDAIGVLIGDELKNDLEKLGFEVIIGETDVDYCLSFIENGDFVFILDSTFYGINSGKITVVDIKKGETFFEKGYSQHQLSLIKLLNSYNFQNVCGYIVGIEASDIDYGIELSKELLQNFNDIKKEVYNVIISKTFHE
ncbi:hydrogenase maturation protease [Clostridium sp. MB40-C1]|uniref:hydrogenase maturation protease n=1 Tax=Clostridium sp. MB40-C1 TaxID=3070996 RepID=UPI0027E0253A|nr:hydrogenase maturation protease [Clostridium sp. MB40-C1]WMJ80205.1 hydrogenase maturation protease [Clostridium sp. MB40-C1]